MRSVKNFFLFFSVLTILIIPGVTHAYNASSAGEPAKLSYLDSNKYLKPVNALDKPSTLIDSGVLLAQNPAPPVEKKQDIIQSTRQLLYRLVNRHGDSSAKFYVFAVFVALIVGGLHALTPGHGKTIVAAYLVGSNGTTRHAFILGMIVTLTHTGSVILLTILALAASHFFLSEVISSLLGIISGVIILVLGIYLLITRLRSLKADGHGDHHHGHHHGHSHDHDDQHIDYEHTHDHGDHHHEHDHQSHHHDDEHVHNDHHHPHNHSHTHELPHSDVSLKSLLTLGISGGIVPCPDAIAILVLAISTKRIFLGLVIMLAFSLGLAIVLTFIGLAMVHSRKIFSKLDGFSKFAPIISVVSAIVVLILGGILTFNALYTSRGFLGL